MLEIIHKEGQKAPSSISQDPWTDIKIMYGIHVPT